MQNESDSTSNQGGSCEFTSNSLYRGSVCRETLQSCLDRDFSDIYISSNVNQDEAEDTARLLADGLEQFGASEECKKSALPFFCLYLFGLCDGNGTVPHTPSASDCLHISTDVCSREWQIGSTLVTLPECSELPDQAQLTCNGEYLCIILYTWRD